MNDTHCGLLFAVCCLLLAVWLCDCVVVLYCTSIVLYCAPCPVVVYVCTCVRVLCCACVRVVRVLWFRNNRRLVAWAGQSREWGGVEKDARMEKGMCALRDNVIMPPRN